MEIGKYDYHLESLAVLFEIIDGNDKYSCGVILSQLDPENGTLINGETGLGIFEQRMEEVLERATEYVDMAKQNGVKHVPGVLNDTIFITLLNSN